MNDESVPPAIYSLIE